MLQVTFLICLLVSFASGELINARPDVRIVGGNDTTIEANPWQVSLQLFGLHNCGGSIISPDTILTAAHCTGLIAPLYEVVAGTADITQPGTRLKVRSSVYHELYDGVEYDIAILKLDKNLTFSDKIQPIALPAKKLADGETVTVTGWGFKSEKDNTSSNILQSVQVQIINNKKCANAYSAVEDVRITSRIICAGTSKGGKDSCEGDSGGPLSKNGVQYGIVASGVGCGEPQFPGVYTNVLEFLDWIHEKSGI